MPSPTVAECFTQAGLALKFLNEVERLGHTLTPNLADIEDALVAAIEGEFTPSLVAAIRRARAQVHAAATSPDAAAAVWAPVIADALRTAGLTPQADPVAMLADLRRYMAEAPIHIKARDITYGSPSAGSNTGNGSLLRCTVDKFGYPLPTGPEAKRARVEEDATGGTGSVRPYGESLVLYGSPPARDNLAAFAGSGFAVAIPSLHPLSARLIRNPGFDTSPVSSDDTSPSSTTAISGWVIGNSASNIKMRSSGALQFGGYPGEPATKWSVEFEASDSLAQTIAEESPGVAFSRDVPYVVAVRWKRLASATGNLTLALGTSSTTATIGSATNDQWNLLYLPLTEDVYYEQFKESSLDLTITVASLATGTVVVDHVVVAPMALVDGTFYAAVSGSTPWLVGDSYTWTDSEAGRAILAFWLWIAFGAAGYLPSVEDATEVTAAGGRTLTFAASDDSITASSGSFVSDGYKPGMLLTAEDTSSNDGTYTIATVTATKITVTGALADEGPLSATATLNATAALPDPT